MASKNSTITKILTNKRRMFLFLLIGFFVIILISGGYKVYAYYHDSIASGILANKVGDFDTGDGDFNLMLYKENDEGKFVRVYAIPSDYYVFNDSLTSCTIPCNDGSGACSYSYDSINKTVSLTSNEKVTCKFYFEQVSNSDISVYVMIERNSGTHIYNSKSYSLVDSIPAYGYIYSGNYVCDSSAELIYNSETKKFRVATSTKNNCYAYFDLEGSTDVVVNTYVQDEFGRNAYTLVETIPANKIYTLNSTKSICTPITSGDAGTISYVDGYINISSNSPQTCDVYLDLETN